MGGCIPCTPPLCPRMTVTQEVCLNHTVFMSWKSKGKMRMKCLQLLKLKKIPVKRNLISSSQECVRSTKSFIELCKHISEIWVLTYFGTQRSTNQKRWCHLVTFFWLQNGRASKRNIISTRPGTRQFIPQHVDDAKDVFQGCGTTARWPCFGIHDYWSSSTWG